MLQQHPTKLHAIDVGGTAEQSIANLWHMPMFSLFRENFTNNSKHHPFGQWIYKQAPLHQLRNICVQVDNDREFDQLLQLLDGLSPAHNRHFFGVRFDRSIDKNSFVDKLHQLLLLLSEKAPALDTLCLMLHMADVAPEMLNLLACHMHSNVTSFCLQRNGFVIFCFRIHLIILDFFM